MSSYAPRSEKAWWGVGLVLGGILVWAAVRNIGAILLAIFIYYATRPLLNRVQRLIPNQSLATLVSLVIFVLPALLIIGYTVNIALHELYKATLTFGAVNIEPYIEPYISQELLSLNWELLINSPREFFTTSSGVTMLRQLFGYTLSSFTIVGSVFLDLVLVLTLAFYFLRDDARISKWMQTHFGIYLPQWGVYKTEVDTDLQTIFFGNILHAIITAIIAVTAYTLLEQFNPTGTPVPYPALAGLLAGIASLIPLIGTKLVYIPIGAYMLVWNTAHKGFSQDALLFPLVFIGVSYLIVDQIPDIGIRPYVSTKRIHMGLVMLAYIVGPMLFGWYGLFLGPVLLVLGLHFVTHILPHLLEPTETTLQ